MNIGSAAQQAGLPAKTIRYYEDIALLSPARRANGYRDYCDNDVHRLRFLRRARAFGFSIDECRVLLSLYADRTRSSADVKAIALDKIAEIDRRIVELRALRDTLDQLAERCHGDDRPDCPIIDDLAGEHQDGSDAAEAAPEPAEGERGAGGERA